MSQSSRFYNFNDLKTLTFLEFGSIDLMDGKKNIWDFRLHQEAYDFFMLARYMKDLVWYKKMKQAIPSSTLDEQFALYAEKIFTQDLENSLAKLAALNLLNECLPEEKVVFMELGSTIMGCIEAMEYLQALGQKVNPLFSKLNLKNILFKGIDISDLLNETALLTHPQHQILTYGGHRDFRETYHFFFAKGVSLLYAINSSQELFSLLNKATIAFFDFSFSLDKPIERVLGTGKKVVYMTATDFLLCQPQVANNLFIDKDSAKIDMNGQIVRANFYWGEPQMIEKVLGEETRLRNSFQSDVGNGNNGFDKLLYRKNYKDSFVKFGNFLKNIK